MTRKKKNGRQQTDAEWRDERNPKRRMKANQGEKRKADEAIEELADLSENDTKSVRKLKKGVG